MKKTGLNGYVYHFAVDYFGIEFAKSRAIRADMPKACQLFIFTCQRANKHVSVPTCQRRANFSTFFKSIIFYIPNTFIPNVIYIFRIF